MNKRTIKPGDTVRCLVGYYKSYALGEKTTVIDVDISAAGNDVLILKNDLCDYGSSMYSEENWAFVTRPSAKPKKEKLMANSYEKTNYFGVLLKPNAPTDGFLHLEESDMTFLRNLKSEAIADVQQHINEGERWIVLQTVALIEPAAPRPPVIITEYK